MSRVIATLAVLPLLAACGGGDEPRAERRATPTATPPPAAGAQPSRSDAERLRPVIKAWADALRRSDVDRATTYFDLPAIVAQGPAYRLRSRDQLRVFNGGLPCGAKLVDVQQNGRYVVGTFELTERPGRKCDAPGRLARVAFVFRGRKFSEWRQVPDARGAPPGPARPEDEIPDVPTPEPSSGAEEV